MPFSFDKRITIGNLISAAVFLVVMGGAFAELNSLKAAIKEKADKDVLELQLTSIKSDVSHMREVFDLYVKQNGLITSKGKGISGKTDSGSSKKEFVLSGDPRVQEYSGAERSVRTGQDEARKDSHKR